MSEHNPQTAGKRTLSRGQRKAGSKEQEQRAERASGGSKPEEKDASRGVTERAAILGNVRR